MTRSGGRRRGFARPAAAIILATACGFAGLRAEVRVLTSIFPLQEFARLVAGDRGEVELLVPPGASVHTWRPRPGDILKLIRSDLFLYVGAGLEPWLDDILKGASQDGEIRCLEAIRDLPLLEAGDEEGEGEEHGHEAEAGHGHGPLDPHVWLDFELDLRIVDAIADALSEIDPEGAPQFRANAGRLRDRLRDLDVRYREGLRDCRGRTLVVAGHAAFGYLARRYGLRQVSLHGLSPDAQPTPGRLMEAVALCRREGITTVFTEPSVSPDLARTLAGEFGGRVLTLHPAQFLTAKQIAGGADFFAIMDENLKALRDGLGCR